MPGECGLGLTVVSAQPLEFDENGDCLHPPEPGIPARTVARKPDGTVVFTIGPEAFDLPAKLCDPPLPRSLSVYFNGALLGTIEKPSPATPSAAAEESRAEGAEFESHAESAEGAEPGPGERSEPEGVDFSVHRSLHRGRIPRQKSRASAPDRLPSRNLSVRIG